jgi:ribonuclease HII
VKPNVVVWPDYCCAVILPSDFFQDELLNDSKQLSEKREGKIKAYYRGTRCIAFAVTHLELDY